MFPGTLSVPVSADEARGPRRAPVRGPVTIYPLAARHEPEVLDYLSRRPLHTVFLRGFIRDNGLVSALNRGIFFCCRDAAGRLAGVALIGHATLFEVSAEAALRAFAETAQCHGSIHMIMGERPSVERFWGYYAPHGQEPRRACREVLMELGHRVESDVEADGLRLADLGDLPQVMEAQALMAFEESGVDPREADPAGFERRCARRIERGRVWVMREGSELVFKADVMSETPEVAYLEGVYVNPSCRGRGLGLACMARLSEELLERVGSLCLLVNERNVSALTFYRAAGFVARGGYDTVFLKPKGR